MIKNIELYNFKSFVNATIIASNLTVFTGLNSGGKSSILQAIRILYDYNCGILPKRINLKSVLSKDSFYKIVVDDQSLVVTKIGENYRLSLTPPSEANNRKSYMYISANRLGPRDIFDLDNNFDTEIGYDGGKIYSFLESHQSTKIHEKMVKAQNGVSLLKSNLDYWMSIVSPGFELNYEIDSSREKVFPFFNGVKPTETGSGLSYVLPIIVSLLVPPQESNILIIENPEAHLHPRGQYELGKMIALSASTGKQIFLETHSEHIIDGIRVAVKDCTINYKDVLFYHLYRDDYETPSIIEKIQVNSEGKLDKWPSGFFDQSTISKMELL